ncbi:MAG: hypothetical protein H6747_13605 [Deltaproteobacteria bacterium]|nr:hypothetical protein [Deltaproteobacteria bacterium]
MQCLCDGAQGVVFVGEAERPLLGDDGAFDGDFVDAAAAFDQGGVVAEFIADAGGQPGRAGAVASAVAVADRDHGVGSDAAVLASTPLT